MDNHFVYLGLISFCSGAAVISWRTVGESAEEICTELGTVQLLLMRVIAYYRVHYSDISDGGKPEHC